MAPDGRMFHQAGRERELFSLKQGLNATTMKDRKNALKRTVAAMTLGQDVSSLFTDVVKNTAGDLSMKKLVYLYIINYAQCNPDLSILIVNTFIKDASDFNPLIRALAIRTMALIPLDKITEYLCDPLHAALKDKDPYVRKTAAVCVAKVYDTNPELAIEEGFIGELQHLLEDGNPMTVSNAVAALSEIADSSHSPNLLSLNPISVRRFLSALSECTEWGQIFILDAIAPYHPADCEEADLMVERIVPRLQHTNPAVVLAAIRVIVNLMPRLDSDDKRSFLLKKMSAPLVTLLTTQPEMQFVALRNINLLIREYPSLLAGDVKVFFVSYADPLYVKSEKLDILVRLTDESNASVVLPELLEYTGEVDVTFAQKSVDCIARIALRLPQVSGRCVTILSGLIQRKVVHLTEQVAIALKDVFREYPRQFESIVEELCQASDSIDDPAAKSALVWIIGEHADRIPSAVSMLQLIVDTIHEEVPSVQLQVLTSCIKAYLLRGPEAQAVTDAALRYATEEAENIDVRDRGFIYMRLISAGSDPAQKVVLSNKQGISDSRAEMSVELRKELLRELSSVASVYHKPAETFEGERKKAPVGNMMGDAMAEQDLLGLEDEDEPSNSMAALAITDGSTTETQLVGDSLLDDILGTQAPPALPAPPKPSGGDLLADLGMGSLSIAHSTEPKTPSSKTARGIELLSAEKGHGLRISGYMFRGPSGAVLYLEFMNTTDAPMSEFAIQFNKNAFGFTQATQMPVTTVSPGSSTTCEIPLQRVGETDKTKGYMLQIAIKYAPGGVVYFALNAAESISALLDTSSKAMSKPSYLKTWQSIPNSSEISTPIAIPKDGGIEGISRTLLAAGIYTVAKRASAKPPVMYLSASVFGGAVILAELTVGPGSKIASRGRGVGEEGLGSFNTFCGALLQ